MDLKKLRNEAGYTQKQLAEMFGLSLRMYQKYEDEEKFSTSLRYKYMLRELEEITKIDEETGILNIEEIKKICTPILIRHKINFCYLFGSYAKGYARPDSDVDLLIDNYENNFDFMGFIEELRVSLKKKVDVLQVSKLTNVDIIQEVFKEGIKIYG